MKIPKFNLSLVSFWIGVGIALAGIFIGQLWFVFLGLLLSLISYHNFGPKLD
jgi:hypothetical protein